jgi:hypothetical protein
LASQAYVSNDGFVRRALQTDGLVCTIAGAVFALGSGALTPFFGIDSVAITLGFGLFILVYGAVLFILSNRQPLDPRLPMTIIVINVLTFLLCVGLLLADPLTLTTEGKVVLFLLADVVAALAIWQFIGLCRTQG